EYGLLRAALDGEYALEREIGRGGMGVVFLGRDVRLDRPVAIKVLPPHLAEQPETRERFLREARTAGQLSHPNVVSVYRADEAAGHPFFVMAFVEGESLAERVRARGPLPPHEAVRILREVAWALAYAHSRGVVHRDVKPENIMIERSGRAVVTDFGIARDVHASKLTEDGYVLGTVHYMSPEQISGGAIDGRSDLYALGIVAFYMLSGRLPFEGGALSAVLVAHATKAPPRLCNVAPAVPERLAAVVDRCLAKEPADRFSTGEALADALGEPAVWRAEAAGVVESSEVISEEEAAAIWRRAAQLQAEASRRLERRLARPAERLRTDSTGEGYRLAEVAAAAAEAGINSEFVALAVAERPAETGGSRAGDLTPFQERVARRLLKARERSISASRVIAAAPSEVLGCIGSVFQGYPYDLRLRETVGGHPLDGGVMLFDVPPRDAMGATGPSMNFKHYMGALEQRQLRVTLHPLSGERAACEVTVYGDLRSTVRRHARWAVPATALGAGGGGAAGYALGASALALGAGLAALPAVIGAAATGAGTALLYGAAYRIGVRRALRQLEKLLADLDANAKGRSLFGVTAPARRPPAVPRGDDSVPIIV
ncbi:MAG: protein kinase domain-containing protein, partial [Gemmatimonadaceae bacterium]